MKMVIQRQLALGEAIIIEADTWEDVPKAFDAMDQRLVDLNKRVLVATDIQKRFGEIGPQVSLAVADVMSYMFNRVTDDDYQAYEGRKAQDIQEAQERRAGQVTLIEDQRKRGKR